MIKNQKVIDLVKMRPGMFLGSMDLNGINNLLEYLFTDILNNNSQPEITIEFSEEVHLIIKIENGNTEYFSSSLNTFFLDKEAEDYIFPKSIGILCLVALSKKLIINIQEGLCFTSFWSEQGVFDCAITTQREVKNHILIDFELDVTYFKGFQFNYEIQNIFLRKYAFLNNCKIRSIDLTSVEQQINIFQYPEKLFHELEYQVGKQLYGKPLCKINWQKKIRNYHYQICFSFIDLWAGQSYIQSYANNTTLIFNGSLIDGVIDGLINAIEKKTEIKINQKTIKKRIILLASVNGDEFIFQGSIKGELQMPKMKKEIKEWISEEFYNYLKQNMGFCHNLLNILSY